MTFSNHRQSTGWANKSRSTHWLPRPECQSRIQLSQKCRSQNSQSKIRAPSPQSSRQRPEFKRARWIGQTIYDLFFAASSTGLNLGILGTDTIGRRSSACEGRLLSGNPAPAGGSAGPAGNWPDESGRWRCWLPPRQGGFRRTPGRSHRSHRSYSLIRRASCIQGKRPSVLPCLGAGR